MADKHRLYHDRFVVFNVMWAFAHIVHVWNQAYGGDATLEMTPAGVSSFVVLLAAFLVALWPRNAQLLIVLCSVQLVQCFITFPFVPDHWMLVAFINLCLLTTYGATCYHQRRVDLGQWLQALTPPCRVVLIICYGAAALAKYNWDFVAPSVGCPFFLANLMTQFVPLPVPRGVLLPIIVLVIETAIPCLLCIPATRHLGVRLGVVFNFCLAFTPGVTVFDFTATVFPLYFLFTADDYTDRLRAVLHRLPVSKPNAVALRSLAFSATAAIIVFAVCADDWLTVYGAKRITAMLFSAYGLLVCCVVLSTVGPTVRWPFKRFSATFVKPTSAQACVYLLVIAWVSLPYVGLRTLGVFTMFSNLRTEGGINNHMFLPRLRLWTLQDEFAEVQSSTDGGFQKLAASQRYINYYELYRYVNKLAPEASLTYLRDGKSYHVSTATRQANLTPPPYWVQKFMLFRPVAINGPAQCGN